MRAKLMVAFPILALIILTACSALNLVSPKSLDEKLVYAYGVNTSLREAAASALDEQVITSSDAEYVLSVTDKSRKLLDAAQSYKMAGDPKTAEGQVAIATQVLLQLKAYLAQRTK